MVRVRVNGVFRRRPLRISEDPVYSQSSAVSRASPSKGHSTPWTVTASPPLGKSGCQPPNVLIAWTCELRATLGEPWTGSPHGVLYSRLAPSARRVSDQIAPPRPGRTVTARASVVSSRTSQPRVSRRIRSATALSLATPPRDPGEASVGHPEGGDGVLGVVAHQQGDLAAGHVEGDGAPDALSRSQRADRQYRTAGAFRRHLEQLTGLVEGLEEVGVVVDLARSADQLHLDPEVVAVEGLHRSLVHPGPGPHDQLSAAFGGDEVDPVRWCGVARRDGGARRRGDVGVT